MSRYVLTVLLNPWEAVFLEDEISWKKRKRHWLRKKIALHFNRLILKCKFALFSCFFYSSCRKKKKNPSQPIKVQPERLLMNKLCKIVTLHLCNMRLNIFLSPPTPPSPGPGKLSKNCEKTVFSGPTGALPSLPPLCVAEGTGGGGWSWVGAEGRRG